MAVQPDRQEGVGLDPGALEALAEAGRAAALGERLTDVARAVVDAAARMPGAELVVARVLEGDLLVTQAVSSPATGLAAELEGARLASEGWPREETPQAVRALAEAGGLDAALVVPVVAGDELVGSVEVYGHERLDAAGTP